MTIEYSPDMDGDADPGEVVWTWVPYEDDPSQGKDRPVVIIGRTGSDLAGVPLTSKNHHRGDEVAVGTGGWDRSGRPSFAKVDQLLTVDPKAVRREGSVLSRSTLRRRRRSRRPVPRRPAPLTPSAHRSTGPVHVCVAICGDLSARNPDANADLGDGNAEWVTEMRADGLGASGTLRRWGRCERTGRC